MTRRLLALVVAVVLALLTAMTVVGCSDQKEEDPVADYTPLTNDELVTRLEQLPGVADAEIRFSDDFSTGRTYSGEVRLAPGHGGDPLRTLDAVNAILRQGEPRAYLNVGVIDPDEDLALHGNSLGLANEVDLRERYGPQPGDGTPPAELP